MSSEERALVALAMSITYSVAEVVVKTRPDWADTFFTAGWGVCLVIGVFFYGKSFGERLG